MFSEFSCCLHCVNRKRIEAKTNAPAEDCYPEEEWCEEDSDNFGTEDGCRWFASDGED